MKTGPENKIKAKVKKLLDQYEIFNFPIAASPYGTRGISDRLGVLPNGRFMAIECKAEGKKLTALQDKFITDVNRNGGVGMVVEGEAGVKRLELFLEEKHY